MPRRSPRDHFLSTPVVVLMRHLPRWFGVVSPEYNTGGNDYYDPPEPGCDWIPVRTTSKRRAIILAVRTWRRRERLPFGHRARESSHFCTADSPYVPPFKDLKAQPLGPCPHGREWCFACSECEAATMAEMDESLADLAEHLTGVPLPFGALTP